MKFEDMKYIHSQRREMRPDETERSRNSGTDIPGSDDSKKKHTRNRSGDAGKPNGAADSV